MVLLKRLVHVFISKSNMEPVFLQELAKLAAIFVELADTLSVAK